MLKKEQIDYNNEEFTKTLEEEKEIKSKIHFISKATKAINFTCYHCKKEQFYIDTLEFDDKKFIRSDRIYCESCGLDNFVYMED